MAKETEKKQEEARETPAKPAKVAEYAVALSFSPNLKDTRSIDTFGVTKEGISGQLKLALNIFYEKCGEKEPTVMGVLEALGVFSLTAPLEQDIKVTVGSSRGYGPGASVWFEFGGNDRIHAFFNDENGKERYWMDVCVNRLTSEGYFPGIRG